MFLKEWGYFVGQMFQWMFMMRVRLCNAMVWWSPGIEACSILFSCRETPCKDELLNERRPCGGWSDRPPWLISGWRWPATAPQLPDSLLYFLCSEIDTFCIFKSKDLTETCLITVDVARGICCSDYSMFNETCIYIYRFLPQISHIYIYIYIYIYILYMPPRL